MKASATVSLTGKLDVVKVSRGWVTVRLEDGVERRVRAGDVLQVTLTWNGGQE